MTEVSEKDTTMYLYLITNTNGKQYINKTTEARSGDSARSVQAVNASGPYDPVGLIRVVVMAAGYGYVNQQNGGYYINIYPYGKPNPTLIDPSINLAGS